MNCSQFQKFDELSTTNGDDVSPTTFEKIAFQLQRDDTTSTSKISSGNGSTSTTTTTAATATTTATRGRNSLESIKPSETNVIDDDLANVTTTTTTTTIATTTTSTKERKNEEEKFKRQRNFVSSENELRTTSTTTTVNNNNNNIIGEEEKGATTTTTTATEKIEIIRQTLLPAKVDGKNLEGDLSATSLTPMPINSTKKKWQASQGFRYKMQEFFRRRQQQQQKQQQHSQQQQQQYSQQPQHQDQQQQHFQQRQQPRINWKVMEEDQRPAETSKIHFLTISNFTQFFLSGDDNLGYSYHDNYNLNIFLY